MNTLQQARAIAATVTDPELPMLTLEDLGVLRDVSFDAEGCLVVSLTPTYSGCPAMAAMRDDVVRALADEGFEDVAVRVSLSPAWSSDWITPAGRASLEQHGISPPGAVPTRTTVSLLPTRRLVRCPQCRSTETSVVSEFGSTACKALYRCLSCLEPFDHLKEI
ncbi:MAG TPA: 1,2-phenylacetyl-CoA epoxidase subunit PaaD [Nocardioidaceae bacterium]|nr:1,2-phenylacetyl-CoA epoxidase subunit PaaD [Nocardioidaceae bacterium]